MEEALASSFVVLRDDVPAAAEEGHVIFDATAVAATRALDGLSQRGQVRAHNIANAETPGFRARRVDFEQNLADAIRRGRPETATTDIVATPSIVDARGNSVDLETEMIDSIRDGLLRDSVVAGFNFKAAQLRTALGGRR